MSEKRPSTEIRADYIAEMRKNDRMLLAGTAGILTIISAIVVEGRLETVVLKLSAAVSVGLATLTLACWAIRLLLGEKWLMHTSQEWAHDEGAAHIPGKTEAQAEAQYAMYQAARAEGEKKPSTRVLRGLRTAGMWGTTLSLLSLAVLSILRIVT